MDHAFASSLETRNINKKNKKGVMQRNKKGKLVRREEYLVKFATGHKAQMNNTKTGKNYRSDITLKAAKKSTKEQLTAVICNPKDMSKHPQQCI